MKDQFINVYIEEFLIHENDFINYNIDYRGDILKKRFLLSIKNREKCNLFLS